MNADDYQTAAARTLIDRPDSSYSDHETMIVWNALGLAGEAGEVADSIKKMVFHRHGEITHDRLAKELGDVLWYAAALATKLGYTLSEIMEMNIAKLQARYPNGYSSSDSKARVDTNAPQDSGYRADILSALQYYGPMTLRELAVRTNRPINILSSSMTLLYRTGGVTRTKVYQDETQRTYYRYTAVNVYRCEQHRINHEMVTG